MERNDVDPAVVARLGAICLRLPEVTEQEAWAGVRWRVRGRTFAHVLPIIDGRPPSYAQAAGTDGPVVTLTFQVTEVERDLFTRLGPPYWAIRWGRDVGGLLLTEDPDWAEIAELVTDSYCLLAPQKLASRVVRPG
ncbi:MAG: MmcQ/YjbR family DNA-binding protein [Marmoricola sp.]